MFYKLLHRRDLYKTFFQVLVAMIMVFVLLICAASPAHAVVGTTSILIPAVIAALESWGISVAADGLDGAEIAEWFYDKLTDWSTYASISLSNIVTGIKMTPLGQVLLNPFALDAVRLFADWFVSENNIVAGGPPVEVIAAGTLFNGYQVWDSCTVVGSSYTYVYTCDSNSHLFVSLVNGTCYVFMVSLGSGSRFHYQRYRNGSSSPTNDAWLTLTNRFGNGYYYTDIVSGYQSVNVPLVSYTYQDVLSGTGGVSSGDGSLTVEPSAEMAVPSASDVQDKDLLINTSLDVGADAAAWYEGVMQKVAANDFTATAGITQAGTITADQVIPQEGITDVDGTVSWPDVTTPIGVSGLDEIFPFCIPFDVYHFFQALAADPVAPSFEIPFVIPNIVDYTFELDLSDFDQVAQILRTVELLAFCVGLAFVTRSFFIRG